jgi:hypothetical protein
MVAYHFYASPGDDENPEVQQYTVFNQADGFLNTVRYVDLIRQSLSPKTLTDLDELGCIPADDLKVPRAPIPASYRNLCGAMYAYLYGELAGLGIDVAGESQLYGFPGQFPGVSLMDWNTGQPNARYRVLKLLHDNLGPGDKLVDTNCTIPYVYAQGFVTRGRFRKGLPTLPLFWNRQPKPTTPAMWGTAEGRPHGDGPRAWGGGNPTCPCEWS